MADDAGGEELGEPSDLGFSGDELEIEITCGEEAREDVVEDEEDIVVVVVEASKDEAVVVVAVVVVGCITLGRASTKKEKYWKC